MTSNQIKYQELLEKERSNRTNEALGIASHAETVRSNLAREKETERSNREKEATNWFSARSLATHQRESERQGREQLAIGWATANETRRSNLARETETHRSNVARENEEKRSNLAREKETHRSNYVRERETNRSNLVNEHERYRSNTSQEEIARQRADEEARHNRVSEVIQGVSAGSRAVQTISDVASTWITGLGGGKAIPLLRLA